MEPIWAVGLMTGTVLDGNIDVALIKTDGERVDDFGTYRLMPYPPSIRSLLEETLKEAERKLRGDDEQLPRLVVFQVSLEMFDEHFKAFVRIGVGLGRFGQAAIRRIASPGRYPTSTPSARATATGSAPTVAG